LAVAIGNLAGSETQGTTSVAIGNYAGYNTQGNLAVAVGNQAGSTTQGTGAIAIGNDAGYTTQGNFAVAVGQNAGQTTQGTGAIAIGNSAGFFNQGPNSIAIGNLAGYTGQASNSIILNASSTQLNSSGTGFYVNPVRNSSGTVTNQLFYDPITSEIIYNNSISPALSLETSRAIDVETSLESLIKKDGVKISPVLTSNNQGTYTVSASSVLFGYPGYKAFNGIKNRTDTIDFGWHGSSESYNRYNGISTLFSTSYLSLNNVNSIAYGEWVQIRNTNTFPLISGVKLYQNDTIYGITSRTIENIIILGSNDGTTFEEISSSAVTFTSNEYNLANVFFDSTKTYSYLRLIITKIRGGGSTDDYVAIGEIEYFSGGYNIINSLSSEIIRAKSVDTVLSNSISNIQFPFTPFIKSKNFARLINLYATPFSSITNMDTARPPNILIKLVGGGGGGGGSSGSNPGGGGGAGAYYEGILSMSGLNYTTSSITVGGGGDSGFSGGSTTIIVNNNTYIEVGGGNTGGIAGGAGLGSGGSGGVITYYTSQIDREIVSSDGNPGNNSSCVYIAGTQYGGGGSGGAGYFGIIGRGGGGGGRKGFDGIAIFMW